MGHTEQTCRRRQRQEKNGLNPKAKAYEANRRSSPRCRSKESEVSKTFLKSHMMVKSDQIDYGKIPIWDAGIAYRRPISLLVEPIREVSNARLQNLQMVCGELMLIIAGSYLNDFYFAPQPTWI